MRNRRLRFLVGFLLAGCSGFGTAAEAGDTLIVREALGVSLPRRTLSSVIPRTPLDAWVTGTRARPPEAGESLSWTDGSELTWERLGADRTGWFPALQSGERYVAVTIDRSTPTRMILEGMGHDIVYVNGEPRPGNPYQQKDEFEAWEPRFDYSRIPIALRAGQNLLLFRYSRGGLKIRLVPPARPVAFNAKDITLPDGVVGVPLDAWGSIAVINARDASLRGCSLVSMPAGGKPDTVVIPPIPAMSVRKLAFPLRRSPQPGKGSLRVRLALLDGRAAGRGVLDTVTIALRVVGGEETRRETFLSGIDGSVQYYAVTPPQPAGFPDRPALFLSLHGAGVEAFNQAASYAPKKWGVLVAPTNRRPYGFSWEDWGRLDALEVLDIATKRYNVDEGRVYLTGHSMGGHGTWFLGATYPDRFAAIGPSAGWITFTTYRFSDALPETSGVQRMLRRAAAPSDLFALAENYRHLGIYVLHGAADDNVPPRQSHMILDRLKPFHRDFVYFEQPGAGHWWDNSPEPGADCVDWTPMFDFFSRHARPGIDRTRTVEFSTANPGISSRDAWVSVDAQERQLAVSTVRMQLHPGLNLVQGTTVNVLRLAIDGSILRRRATATVELDGQKNDVRPDGDSTGAIWFAKEGGKWREVNPPSPAVKNARRNGTFKEAFRNRMALVYGTAGTPEENRWAFTRARYDAEKLWYQGNGSVDVLADDQFDPSKEPDRNVVLYGNSRTHRLWKTLLSDSPIHVDRGSIDIGSGKIERPDICCIFLRPRAGSAVASVGVVSGTGIRGFALSQGVSYLEPGLGLPDCTVFSSDVSAEGDGGIILTGFFGQDWSIESGDFWRKP